MTIRPTIRPGDLCMATRAYVYNFHDEIPCIHARFDGFKFVTVIAKTTINIAPWLHAPWCFVMTDNMQTGWIPESYLLLMS